MYAQWIIPGSVKSADKNTIVRVTIKVDRNGTIKDMQFIHLSENLLLNASVKDAIINAQPFPAFPKDLSDDFLDITINFDPEN